MTLFFITGSGFNLDVSSNGVYFKGEGTSSYQAEVTKATATELTVKVPAKAVTGRISVNINYQPGVFVDFHEEIIIE